MRHLPIALLLILALVCAPASASAQEKPYLVHFGLGFAKATNTNAPDGSVGLQAGMIYRIPSSPKVGIGAEIGYVMLGSNTLTLYDGFNSYEEEYKWSTVPVTAQVYFFPQLRGPTPVLTAGVGFYSLKIEASAASGGYSASASATDTKLGLNFGGGFLFGSSRSSMRFGIDARYHMIMTDVETTNVICGLGRLYF
jgi:hypothetical protein